MVVGGGFGPPMFTTWVAVLQTALFGQLQKPYDGSTGWIQTSDLGVNSSLRYHCATVESKNLPINCGILCNPLDERRWTNEQKAMHRVGLDPTSPQATLDGGLGNLCQDSFLLPIFKDRCGITPRG